MSSSPGSCRSHSHGGRWSGRGEGAQGRGGARGTCVLPDALQEQGVLGQALHLRGDHVLQLQAAAPWAALGFLGRRSGKEVAHTRAHPGDWDPSSHLPWDPGAQASPLPVQRRRTEAPCAVWL